MRCFSLATRIVKEIKTGNVCQENLKVFFRYPVEHFNAHSKSETLFEDSSILTLTKRSQGHST